MKNSSRKIWEHPWRYTEGIIIAAWVILSGILLQVTNGNIKISYFGAPFNTLIGILFITALLFIHFTSRNRHVTRWLSGAYATIPAISALLLLIIIMGLVPQISVDTNSPKPTHPFTMVGWNQMTTSWPFILICFYNLLILGLTIMKRTTRKQSWRDIGFYLNHLGLFIALLGGILGSTDIERLTMNIREGETEWRGTNRKGIVKELPIAIQLDTFNIELYHPKLVIIDNKTGEMLPSNRPENYIFEEIGETVDIAGITLEITDYLPHAAIINNDISVNVIPMKMEGSTSALKVKVNKEESGDFVEGWVSNGSYLFPPLFVEIDQNKSVAMPVQEIKKYSSQITTYTAAGNRNKAVIEVNKPLRLNNWMIYQYSYDNSKGKDADISVFELVSDPYQKVVYTGFFLLIAGALFLFIVGPKKKTI